MKTPLALLAFASLTISAHAQSVTLRIISNDGSIQATNTHVLAAERVTGLITKWNANTITRTNAGLPALTFGVFVIQEITDKGDEWALQAGRDAIKAAGVTNSIPDMAARKWFSLSGAQQTNAVNYLNAIPQ